MIFFRITGKLLKDYQQLGTEMIIDIFNIEKAVSEWPIAATILS